MANNENDQRSTVWEPTCLLRWKTVEIPFDAINLTRVLQQLWKGNSGEREWRNIEVVDE